MVSPKKVRVLLPREEQSGLQKLVALPLPRWQAQPREQALTPLFEVLGPESPLHTFPFSQPRG